MSDCILPQELVLDILHRLPPKSLVKCTSICKHWKSLITHPSFISRHRLLLSAAITATPFLLLQLCDETRFPPPSPAPVLYSLRRDDPLLSEFSSLHLPTAFDSEFSVVGICNGLVCITDSAECYNLILCNPCVRRYVSLPKPRDYPCLYNACVGFGFDSLNDDYKVVRIVCMQKDDERYGLCAPEVDLYSLATGYWKYITHVAPVCSLCFVGTYAPNAFIDGIVHWGARRRLGDDDDDDDDNGWYRFVLTFDFQDEVFGEIMLPHCLARGSSDAITVIGGGKSLCVYHVSNSPCTCNIWVMKEYGVVESWNKVFTFRFWGFFLEAPSLGITLSGVTGPPTAVCVRNSGEILLLLDEAGKGCLYSLDCERKTFKDLEIGGQGYTWYIYSAYYAESLVLLDKAGGLVSY